MKLIYRPLDDLSDTEIEEILNRDDINEIITLPLSVGMNYPKWKYAQDLCVKLSEHEDPRVRANAIFGLAHIARTKGKLEKHIVKPVILRALRNDKEFEGTVIDAISDINMFMGWNIGAKTLTKEKE